MSKLRTLTVVVSTLSLPAPALLAQTTANERNCPSSRTDLSSGKPMPEAIPPFVGPGSWFCSPNQSLCLPRLAPVPTGVSPLAFIVQGVEPGDRVDTQGTVYVVSIRGVPGGVDLWRWYSTQDGSPNSNQTLPFRYEGQPDNCGIFSGTFGFTKGGCANNVGSPENLGLAPGGGDADIAVNGADPTTGIPNLPLTSLALVPGVTATHSADRGENFSTPNVLAALIGGDDRQWNDAIDAKTGYLAYHDIGTFNIDVQRSNDGGATYANGLGEAIDAATFPAAGAPTLASTANLAAQIKIDHSNCSSRGNLYQLFVAPNDALENNVRGAPMRSAYVGVSIDAKLGMPAFMFTDYKVYTGPVGARNNNIFPALAVDQFGFLYSVWSDNRNIFFTSSSDHGKTWTPARVVNQGATVGKANVFPWVAADANGHVVVAWLGADKVGNSNDRAVMEPGHTPEDNGPCTKGTTCMTKWAKWNVYVLETVNGHAATPTFTQYTASDHVIHRGTVSTGGLGGGADRNLADFFQVALDPQHRANISFADDHVVSPLSMRRTGTDNPDDPVSFRVGVPYFTYRLQPPAGVVTVGSCAGVQGEEEVEDEGQGEDDHHDEMAFVDKQQPEENGTLIYHDPGQSLDVTSSNGVRSISYSGNCVSFSGDAKVNGQLGYQFVFGACDFSATGGHGSFSISLTRPAGYSSR